MACPIERPVCKRSIMMSNAPYKKKECPINIKPKCALAPTPCPVLPQEETKCGYAKIMGEDINVNDCPCKACFLITGCPITKNNCVNKPQASNNNNVASKWPDKIPPCIKCTDGENETTEKQIINNQTSTKQVDVIRNIQPKPNCSFASSPRPLPCSECILQELSDNQKDGKKPKSCPYLVLPNMCRDKCFCPEVPSVELGPPCPFSPKPCPCCAAPRCPLSRQTDCIMRPKPKCCLLSPNCTCSADLPCPRSPSCLCGICSFCLSPCQNSCCCSKCPPPCPLFSTLSCCSPVCSPPCQKPSTVNSICASTYPPVGPCDPLCPLLQPGCSSPSCIPCLLKSVECILNPCSCKSICPLVPPPCTLTPKNDDSNSKKENEETAERTFHLPTCPVFEPPCGVHNLVGKNKPVCPFSPKPCPIGGQCPFPVSIAQPERNVDLKRHVISKDIDGANGDSSNTMSKSATVILEDQIMNESKTSYSSGDASDLESPDVTHKLPGKNKANQDKINGKGGSSNTMSKSVTFSLEYEIINGSQSSYSSGDGNRISNSMCPYSPSCGAVPEPGCPAAKFLCPERYIKPKKVKKKPCPFKKCMNKTSCPLNAVKPKINCPLGDFPNCPLAEEPECPLAEFVDRCALCCRSPCVCSCSVPTCCVCPLECSPCPPSICPCTSTDGSTHLKPTCKDKRKDLNRLNTLPYPTSDNGVTLSGKKYRSPRTISNKNDETFSISNTLDSSFSSFESPMLDGCCSACREPCERIRHPSVDSSSTSECPYESLAPKTVCPLAPPKCPLTPKPTTCPLTRKPDPCSLTVGGMNCPVKFPPCKKFPEGRCPMGDINTCNCDYPVSPCLLPIQDPDVIAPPQFCLRENCCMGLPIPPSVLKNVEGDIEEGPFYQFKDTKPGKEETKHYIEILKDPPGGEVSLFGTPKKRAHDNWKIVKHGEGYLRCKTIAEKMRAMGPTQSRASQFNVQDCPLDEETRTILENRKKHLRAEREINQLKLALGIPNRNNKRYK